MGKILKLTLMVFAILGITTILTGCLIGEKNNNYKVISKDKKGELSFEFNDGDYKLSSNKDNSITLKNSANYSEINIKLLHEAIYSSSITKEEIDFNSEDYHNYNKIKIGNYNGWEVYKKDYQYEVNLVLTKEEKENNKVYAVDIKVNRDKNIPFDINKIIESKEFKHILDTLKLKISEKTSK